MSDEHNLQKMSTTLDLDVQIGNSRKKKYEHRKESEDLKRKKLTDSGDAYNSKKGVPVAGISPPTEVSAKRYCNKYIPIYVFAFCIISFLSSNV